MSTVCKWLVLVPTALELQYLSAKLKEHARMEICGFGPIIAAARTASLILQFSPEQIVLCGIAGSLSDELTIGNAYQFKRVVCHGVGVGQGADFLSADKMGWKQWTGTDVQIGVELPLSLAGCQSVSPEDLLVTVCSASADAADALNIKKTYGHAGAEDMEGFSVAAAAALDDVPITIVRGISNRAGNRNHESWQIESAMQSVNRQLEVIVRSNP